MPISRLRCAVPIFVAAVAACVIAAERPPGDSVMAAPKRYNVARVELSRVTYLESMQKRLMSLQMDLNAARQSGDNQRVGRVGQQAQQFRTDVMKLLSDTVHEVAKEKHIDLVVFSAPSRRGAEPELQVMYKADDVNLPDITDAVIARVTQLAATRPALASQPASMPASQPLQLAPRIRLPGRR